MVRFHLSISAIAAEFIQSIDRNYYAGGGDTGISRSKAVICQNNKNFESILIGDILLTIAIE
jgi:hypothetical protein